MSKRRFQYWSQFLGLLLAAGCNARTPEGPVLEVDRLKHEFPREQSGSLQTEFILQNTGNQVLEIRDIKTSCGCAVATAPKSQLQPGATTRMKVQVNRPPAGEKTVTVTIMTNSDDTPEIPIEITSWAISDESRVVKVSPSRILFPERSTTGSRARVTYMTFERQHTYLIKAITCDLPFIEIQSAGTEERRSSVPEYVRRDYQFDIIIREHDPCGHHFGQITIRSHPSPTYPALYKPLEVEVFLRKTLWAEPESLLANLDSEETLPTWRVGLHALSSAEECKFIKLHSDEDWLTAEFIENDMNSDCENENNRSVRKLFVQVTSLPETIPARGSIRIQTNNVACPEIEIPVILLKGSYTTTKSGN
jgi:Protein of unknown function (DUF1573)